MPHTRATHKMFEMKRTVECLSMMLSFLFGVRLQIANKQLLRSSSKPGGTSVCHIVKSVLLKENKWLVTAI